MATLIVLLMLALGGSPEEEGALPQAPQAPALWEAAPRPLCA